MQNVFFITVAVFYQPFKLCREFSILSLSCKISLVACSASLSIVFKRPRVLVAASGGPFSIEDMFGRIQFFSLRVFCMVLLSDLFVGNVNVCVVAGSLIFERRLLGWHQTEPGLHCDPLSGVLVLWREPGRKICN